ncbi:hypothetical protein O6H91_03G035600 [Diphasiastrum complanatum]|uniref:Uncharacterized protein n=2 Tax=Diphasiastrum complanatum TaxID=34168 RepID=A0ACC2E5E0_DIPCM|nr:hypothetical protein O6H91_03G035500 [Diphasiastrum complanatum]KAJ7561607.1 hypothetical protein O6H91_03G035600 [Diphasiastrum complanatum]
MDWLPGSMKGVLVTATSCGAALLGGAKVATAALSYSGFTSVGPAAGSYAAAWMSSIASASGGAVPAGSVFATIQSLAMTQAAGVLGATTLIGGGLLGGGVLGGVLYFAGQKLCETDMISKICT